MSTQLLPKRSRMAVMSRTARAAEWRTAHSELISNRRPQIHQPALQVEQAALGPEDPRETASEMRDNDIVAVE